MAKKRTSAEAGDHNQSAKQKGIYRRLMLWVFRNKEPDEVTGELLFSQAGRRNWGHSSFSLSIEEKMNVPSFLR